MSRLRRAHQHLLTLHRALLEAERIAYEREHGKVSAGAFLGQVIAAPEFAWLQPLTALIVGIDEAADAAEPDAETGYLDDVRALLMPCENGSEFQGRYANALQTTPDVLIAHRALMLAIA